MYLDQKIATHFVQVKKQDHSDVSPIWKMQGTIISYKENPWREKRSERSEDIQKETCNRNNFIPIGGLDLKNIQFL